ncbi:MAG: 2-C-methyl-D-erythritol 2,4-cyclodiphosphate synthase [Anaerohalosphaera sp.]|nr:2-C-methyl-D-erythritol 2,4-cyclodiphosphate synthase [Anaerohalosphaera sp.]
MNDIEYEYRIGIGTDIHRLTPDKPLMLGGMEIPYPLGLLAHSDGDVALHAIIDAVMGAAGMGDIGTLFPDTDPKWKDVDSKELVLRTRVEYENKEWEIVNVDLIIHAEQPKLGPFKGQMKRAIAGLLGIDFSHVNVKAKTNEGIGEIGNGNAISATATALLRRRFKRRL